MSFFSKNNPRRGAHIPSKQISSQHSEYIVGLFCYGLDAQSPCGGGGEGGGGGNRISKCHRCSVDQPCHTCVGVLTNTSSCMFGFQNLTRKAAPINVLVGRFQLFRSGDVGVVVKMGNALRSNNFGLRVFGFPHALQKPLEI
jgi:hypothetical protein